MQMFKRNAYFEEESKLEILKSLSRYIGKLLILNDNNAQAEEGGVLARST
jgi:hypothetical protein